MDIGHDCCDDRRVNLERKIDFHNYVPPLTIANFL